MQALNAQTVQQFIEYTGEEGFNFEIVVNKTFTTAGNGLWSNVVKDVFVESISMFISTVNEEGDFYDGDLAINYTEATWDNAKDGLIYTDRAFIAQVHAFLINAGFDNEAVNNISYSEQGMQDDERVSCDANEFADYLRNISNAKITIVE
jgi:hypothetical protein